MKLDEFVKRMAPEVPVVQEDANNYCRILSILEMEEEGDSVAEVQHLVDSKAELLEALRELLDSHDDVNTCDADSQFRADTRHEAAIRNARAAIAKAMTP